MYHISIIGGGRGCLGGEVQNLYNNWTLPYTFPFCGGSFVLFVYCLLIIRSIIHSHSPATLCQWTILGCNFLQRYLYRYHYTVNHFTTMYITGASSPCSAGTCRPLPGPPSPCPPVVGYRQRYRGNIRQGRVGCSPCMEYQRRSARLVKQREVSGSGEVMEGDIRQPSTD